MFIHAPLQYRVERVKRLYEMSGGEAKDMISKIDKKRAAYYNSYSDKKWGEIGSYHLSFDSSLLSTGDGRKGEKEGVLQEGSGRISGLKEKRSRNF